MAYLYSKCGNSKQAEFDEEKPRPLPNEMTLITVSREFNTKHASASSSNELDLINPVKSFFINVKKQLTGTLNMYEYYRQVVSSL